MHSYGQKSTHAKPRLVGPTPLPLVFFAPHRVYDGLRPLCVVHRASNFKLGLKRARWRSKPGEARQNRLRHRPCSTHLTALVPRLTPPPVVAATWSAASAQTEQEQVSLPWPDTFHSLSSRATSPKNLSQSPRVSSSAPSRNARPPPSRSHGPRFDGMRVDAFLANSFPSWPLPAAP
jgi:hypothetical protein